jgi:hypothetical protein
MYSSSSYAAIAEVATLSTGKSIRLFNVDNSGISMRTISELIMGCFEF